MAYRSRAHRHPGSRTPAAPARAPPRPGERGVTVWDGDSPSMLSPGSTTQGTRGGGPAHKSGSRASSLTSTALNTFAPSLPTHPPRPGPRRAISGHAISGDLGPRRVTSGDLAQSRAIPELHATPLHPTPPHPPPRRAISGDLGASLARRHTCSKKRKGLVGATGLTRTCSLGSRRLSDLIGTQAVKFLGSFWEGRMTAEEKATEYLCTVLDCVPVLGA